MLWAGRYGAKFLVSDISVRDGANDKENQDLSSKIAFPLEYEEDEQRFVLKMVCNHHDVAQNPVGKRLRDDIGGKGNSLILLFHGNTLQCKDEGAELTNDRRFQWDGHNTLC